MNTTTLNTSPPAFAPEQALQIAREHFGLDGQLKALVSERDQNFQIETPDGEKFVLKIANPAEDRQVVDFQARALRHVAQVDPQLPLPRVRKSLAGTDIVEITETGQPRYFARVVSFLDGTLLDHAKGQTDLFWQEQGTLLAQLGLALRGFFHPAAGHELLWDMKYALRLRDYLPAILDDHQRQCVSAVLDSFETHAWPVLSGLRAQVIHNDLNPGNLLVDPDNTDQITGIIDFGDLVHSPLIVDLAVAAAYQLADNDTPLAPVGTMARAYHRVTALEETELEILFDLIATRVATSVAISSWRASRYPENAEYILTSNPRAVRMLDRLAKIGRSDAADYFRDACDLPRRASGATTHDDELISRRNRLLGPAYRLFYDQPLHFVRGEGVWLYDPSGRRYLDAYNNVAQVGHCHPRVVAAISRQTALLNTHTRYLHQSIVDYAERLQALFPFDDPVCLFCCTGSEANELAYRIAQSHTGGTGVVVTAHAYHGNTSTVSQFSTSDTPPQRRGEFVQTIAAPDSYRGTHTGRTTDSYVSEVATAIKQLQAKKIRPAMLLVDTVFSCDGVISAADNFLAQAAELIRSADGLFVADEVQAGFGRTGTHLWGFARHGVKPDIVTLGKPMGNGYPLAAVVCPRRLVEAFANQIDYFNTFGGNPVACAAGLAVLDVLEAEGLQKNACDIGGYLNRELLRLQTRYELIGDVRGSGLFIGVELVRDRSKLTPAASEAKSIVNAMRQNEVLIGATGLHGNVLKIRPPLVFSRQNADQLIAALESALGARE